MTPELFEELLNEDESTSLDFKRDQYPFAKVSDDEKSELLKDILGFVNTWRRTDAYILIGVDDVKGGRSNVVGIAETDHLPDHSVQQFVNSLTSQPVQFRYRAFVFEGKQIGVIQIDQQHHPIYLKRDFGKLKKNEVYVRRGSSTDPTKPAMPEEIARMGQSAAPQTADIVVEFAELDREQSLGPSITWQARFCEMPKDEEIPEYGKIKPDPLGLNLAAYTAFDRPNPDYYVELSNYIFAHGLGHMVRLVVKNGSIPANKVRCEIAIPKDLGVIAAEGLPDLPEKKLSPVSASSKAMLANIRRKPYPGDVAVRQNADQFQIELECGDLQPGRNIWSRAFVIAKNSSGEAKLSGQIFAENLPRPKDFTLTINPTITNIKIGVSELKKLGPPDVQY